MERPTKSMTTSSGIPYSVREWVTGGEARVLGIMANHIKTVEDEVLMQDKLIEVAVVSFNGKTETKEILEAVKDLKFDEYGQVITALSELFFKNDSPEAEKKS